MSTALTAQNDRSVTVVDLIRELATDDRVSVEKLAGLMGLQERAEAREAERQFNAAFARLQAKLPRVKKNGTIDLGKGKPIPFAKWEDVDSVIRPILSSEGFALSFTSKPASAGVLMTAILTHEMGHSRESEMQLPPDAGPGRNALQAIGSSHSYGKRYLTFDLLNLVCEGEDTDGSKAFPLTPEQRENVQNMVDACEIKGQGLGLFLKYAQAGSIEMIQQHRYEDVMQMLRAKHRKQCEGK